MSVKVAVQFAMYHFGRTSEFSHPLLLLFRSLPVLSEFIFSFIAVVVVVPQSFKQQLELYKCVHTWN